MESTTALKQYPGSQEEARVHAQVNRWRLRCIYPCWGTHMQMFVEICMLRCQDAGSGVPKQAQGPKWRLRCIYPCWDAHMQVLVEICRLRCTDKGSCGQMQTCRWLSAMRQCSQFPACHLRCEAWHHGYMLHWTKDHRVLASYEPIFLINPPWGLIKVTTFSWLNWDG